MPLRHSEASLRAAIQSNELVVHYQPVVDLARGAVVGVEALVRWQHPVHGLLLPDNFIPVAEAGDLIIELGTWVLERACAQAVQWHTAGFDLDVAVNISTRQITLPGLVNTVRRVLAQTGMDPRRLVLEVTESTVVDDAEVASRVFGEIVRLGVTMCIDDFGTGYSSLLYLRRYPVSALKIDRSFVGGMGVNLEDDAIVASVVGLANSLGGACIAEGVETREQYEGLRSLRCGLGQGWLFGRAVPASEVPAAIADCELLVADLQAAAPSLVKRREEASDLREMAADMRDHAADLRDRAADRRDSAADMRDHAGDDRDAAGDLRDEVSEQREVTADSRHADGDTGMLARGEAAVLRSRADIDRATGAQERSSAESNRDTASIDRDMESVERGEVDDERSAATARRSLPTPRTADSDAPAATTTSS